MAQNTTQVFIPGKAYEIILTADFMSGRINDDAQRQTRVALKEGETRKKGRGYRVLVDLNEYSAQYLCDWLSDFLVGSEYSKLGTAEALAVRTITDRICEIANVCSTAREKRQVAVQRRVAAMQAGRERKAEEQRKAEAEAAKLALEHLERDVPLWRDEYNTTLDKISKTKDTEKVGKLFNRLDNLQRAIINGNVQIRTLKAKVAV